jgi:acrylyl-CoA reductase (NADPH)
LRGVTLAGIDSARCPIPERREAWQRLVRDLDRSKLDSIVSAEVGLGESIEQAGNLLAGKVKGRIVVDVNR